MKYFFSFLLLITICLSGMAQDRFPNGFFLDWHKTEAETKGQITFPEFWEPFPKDFFTTSNQGTRTVSYNPTVMRTSDAYIGYQACLLKTAAMPFFGPTAVAAGSLMIGDYIGGMNPLEVVDWGKPWNGRPERFVGFYKYIPVDNDECSGWVILTHFDNGVRDTVASAYFTSAMKTTTVNQYTKFDIPFTYHNANDPDTIIMALSSSADGHNFNGGIGSSLYLDYLQLLYPGETSVNEQNNSTGDFWIFPNPTSNYLNIVLDENLTESGRLEILSLTGKLLLEQKIVSLKTTLDLQSFPTGAYVFRVFQNEKQITSGNFVKQ